MKRQYIVVEHRQPEYVKHLRADLKDAHDRITNLVREYRLLEQKYGWEIQLNSELIDLLNQNDISYREHLNHSLHPF